MSHHAARATAEGTVLVRYWAAARAAAGVDTDSLPVDGEITLAALLDRVCSLHADRPRLSDVVSICSVLIGDRPVRTSDPDQVPVRPGETVELLPPFAGG